MYGANNRFLIAIQFLPEHFDLRPYGSICNRCIGFPHAVQQILVRKYLIRMFHEQTARQTRLEKGSPLSRP